MGEEEEEESRYHSFHSNTGEQNHNSDNTEPEGNPVLNGGGATAAVCATELQQQGEEPHVQANGGGPPAPVSGASDDPEGNRLVPMTLYLHRVQGLVLALLVEPHFLSDTAAMEEVVRSSANTCASEPLVQVRSRGGSQSLPAPAPVQNPAQVSEPNSAHLCLSSITAVWRPSTAWRPT